MQTTTLTGIQATSSIGSSLAAIGGYSAPAGGATISHLNLCNKTGSAIVVSCSLYNGTTDYYLAFQVTIAPGDSLNPLGESGQRLVLASGWTVRALCQTASACDATMSVTQYS